MKDALLFILNSTLLGIGLAMDAFSVSLANGLNDSGMKKRRMLLIAGVFGFFQAAMPMIGWICVHTIVESFAAFETFIPYIALALLGFIGGKMLFEGIKNTDGKDSEDSTAKELFLGALIVQGIATSIDALSVGFTIADYRFNSALLCSLIIAAVTFLLCMIGIVIGKRCGNKLSGKASILGGVILIGIGTEIFLTGIL